MENIFIDKRICLHSKYCEPRYTKEYFEKTSRTY